MLSVTKIFHFCYGHYLPDYDGVCAQQHGHNAILEVEFKEDNAWKTVENDGMVIDFKTIKFVVQPIIDKLDHKNLNEIIEIPTAENIVLYILEQFPRSNGIKRMIVRIRLYETPNSYAEWKRD